MQRPNMKSLPLLQDGTDGERAVRWIYGPFEDQGAVVSCIGYQGSTSSEPAPSCDSSSRYSGRLLCFTREVPGTDHVTVGTKIHLPQGTNPTEPHVTSCSLAAWDGTNSISVTNEDWADCLHQPTDEGEWWDYGWRPVPKNRMFVITFVLASRCRTDIRGYAMAGRVESPQGQPRVATATVPLWVYPNVWSTPSPPDFSGAWEGEVSVIDTAGEGPPLHATEPMRVEIMQSAKRAYVASYHGFFTEEWPPDAPQARAVEETVTDTNGRTWLRFTTDMLPYSHPLNDWGITPDAGGLLVRCRYYRDPPLDFTVSGTLQRT